MTHTFPFTKTIKRKISMKSLQSHTRTPQTEIFSNYVSLNIAKMKTYVFNREENIVVKGENAGHFLFLQCFEKPSLSGLLV